MPYASSILQRKFGLGQQYDPDALAYFSTAGITAGNSTPTSYDNAASFNGTNKYLSVASNSTLQIGGTSFSYAFWIYPTISAFTGIVTKTDGASAREVQIFYNSGTISFSVFPNGTNIGGFTVVSAGTAPLNTWSFVVCYYNSSNNTINVSINANAPTTTGSVSSLAFSGASPLRFGSFDGSSLYFSGSIAGVGFWKRALSSTEITSIYNGGIGLTYSGIQGAGLTTNLVSYWALNQTSVTADSAGSNTLTNNNSVTASVTGPIASSMASSRQLINSFVKGIKGLGLWSNMVCWPLRSSQNANGTTAYSLGGAGTYNGTLVNAPTWTSTGLLNSATGYVTTGLYTGSTASNNFVVVNETANGSRTYYGDLSSSNSRGTRAIDTLLLVGNGTSFTAVSYSATTLNSFKALNFDITASTGTVYLNGSSIASGSLTGLPPTAVNPLTFLAANDANAGNVGQYVSGTMAFYLWLKTNISSSSTSQLYTTYKQTLGQGLALP